jgi:CO/xanthine dehydrogenase Mo-binding subunit
MTTFVADVEVPGILYGKFLRDPHVHERILKIDTSRAQKIRRYR